MKWGRNLSLSVRALSRARLRTLLSASSMMIGITAVTLLFGVGAGAEQAYQAALESMGKNLLSVGSQRKESGALRGVSRRYQTLTLDDWRAIKSELDSVALAAPIAMNDFDLRYGGESVTMTVIGTTPEFQMTNNQPLTAGRFLDELDLLDSSRVAVIGSQVERELFRDRPALGERLLVAGAPFIIIGVLAEKGADSSGSPQDNRILVPITTAMRRLLSVDYVDRIFVQAISRPMISATIDGVRGLLRSRHGLLAKAADDFTVRDQAAVLATLNKTEKSLSRFLTGIAALTLGLASVGLMAVSLLSVRERHAEIGLRLALGALPRQVMLQFLSEAVMIALLGAVAGLLAGAFGIIVGAWLLDWQLALTGISVFYTFLIAFGLSLLFGAYPALRAAKLDPIIALSSGR
ncbi:MAG: FtsX-like permease family protein [Xanthomonadales bacterium]|nr:FtsX-like permease family protein [Xanthomonadales bacterium]